MQTQQSRQLMSAPLNLHTAIVAVCCTTGRFVCFGIGNNKRKTTIPINSESNTASVGDISCKNSFLIFVLSEAGIPETPASAFCLEFLTWFTAPRLPFGNAPRTFQKCGRLASSTAR
jgi:hypothetical protein